MVSWTSAIIPAPPLYRRRFAQGMTRVGPEAVRILNDVQAGTHGLRQSKQGYFGGGL
jgi:hypothetical protein